MVANAPPFIGPGLAPPFGVLVIGVGLAPAVAVPPIPVLVGRKVVLGVGVVVAVGVFGIGVFVKVGPPDVEVGGRVGVALGTFGIGGLGPPFVAQMAVTFIYISITPVALESVKVITLAGCLK